LFVAEAIHFNAAINRIDTNGATSLIGWKGRLGRPLTIKIDGHDMLLNFNREIYMPGKINIHLTNFRISRNARISPIVNLSKNVGASRQTYPLN
jgi:hypothetical protein